MSLPFSAHLTRLFYAWIRKWVPLPYGVWHVCILVDHLGSVGRAVLSVHIQSSWALSGLSGLFTCNLLAYLCA
jgi:hypothetical protein